MIQDLLVADSICILWTEADNLPFSVSHLFCYQCLAGKATQWAILFRRNFIKQWFCSKLLCLLCCMLPACRLEPMISTLSSIGFNFQLPVDFRFNVCFHHAFSVLHHNSMETIWFSLTMHESPFTEEKSMQSSSLHGYTRVSMIQLKQKLWYLKC